jgi:hypothetical protein
VKITVESTSEFKLLGNKRFRVWSGESESGVKVKAFIAVVQPLDATPEELKKFEREFTRLRLKEPAQ